MNFQGRQNELIFLNSDYDLSEVCVDKCDDDYLQCVSSCSASECLLECGRALSACGDCKLNTSLDR